MQNQLTKTTHHSKKGETTMNTALHTATQAELQEKPGQSKYETRLRQRILDKLTKYPGITKAKLANELGFIPGGLFESTFEFMLADGLIKVVPRKEGFEVNEQA
jgi:hypothetical protein